MSQLSYHEQVDRENILRLRNLIKDLPPFCGDFFRGIEPRTSSRTRIAYAYDLHVFFDFLHKENPALARITVQDIKLDQLDQEPGGHEQGTGNHAKNILPEKFLQLLLQERAN